MSDTKMKLCYFDARGMAETIRLLFAVSETEYTDYRYPLKVIDWKTFKFERDEFDLAKKNGKLIKSLDKVPYLEVGDNVICQSKSIERYLSTKFGLFGNTPEEAAHIDSICEWVRDIKQEYQTVRKTPENEKEVAMNKWFDITLPSKLILLDNIVEDTYAVGKKLSLADIVLFSFLTDFFDNKSGCKSALSKTTNINSVVNMVRELPQIIKWLNTRPITGF